MINNIYKIDFNKNKKIALFSDIHLHKSYSLNILDKVYNNLLKNKPDYICIPGDILDEGINIENKKVYEMLKKFITDISKICYVIISLGNHDISYRKNFKTNVCINKYEFLNEIDNVFVLNNSVLVIDNINFIGYNLPFEYFSKRPYENYKKYMNDLDNKINISNDNLNILLSHTPIYINNILNSSNIMKKLNLVLSGHMHNGMMPILFEKLKTNKGIISPYKKLFPKYARGYFIKNIDNHKIHFVISGGIIKLKNKLLNKVFDIHIEYILI